MLRTAPYLVVALTLTACTKNSEQAAPARSDDSERAAATAEAPPPQADGPSSLASAAASAAATAVAETDDDTPLGAVSLPDTADCARRCVMQNQMRAVAPEQIEADCRRSCHAECLEFCKDGQGDRPVNFEETCRADCDKQRDRIKQKR